MSTAIRKLLITRFILLLFLIFAGYYLLFLRPLLALPGAYDKTAKILSQHHANLLQNRLALVGLAKLDPQSQTAHLDKNRLFSALTETNRKGLELLNAAAALPKVRGVPTQSTRFLNSELNEAAKILSEKTRSLFNEQKPLIAELEQMDVNRQRARIRADDAVKLLTDHTNLILEYEFWMKRIQQEQRKLAQR